MRETTTMPRHHAATQATTLGRDRVEQRRLAEADATGDEQQIVRAPRERCDGSMIPHRRSRGCGVAWIRAFGRAAQAGAPITPVVPAGGGRGCGLIQRCGRGIVDDDRRPRVAPRTYAAALCRAWR